VSIDTTLVNMATIVTPLAGAALAGFLGIEVALRFGAFLSICGVVLFALEARRRGSGPPNATGSAGPPGSGAAAGPASDTRPSQV